MTGGAPAPLPVRMRARLQARPSAQPVSSTAPRPGLHTLSAGPTTRRVLLYVPAGLDSGDRATLVLALHGAGGSPQSGLAHLRPLADANRLLLLAPQSQGSTWDVIRGRWGPDLELIDRALAGVFSSYPVDAARVAVSGFSDGASYGLSLGLGNGDLFTHVVAFSPGFVAPVTRVGEPEVYVSHGVHDTVLPIDRTTRRIVPRLRQLGYAVHLREFDGAHAVPPAVAEDAVRWLAGG